MQRSQLKLTFKIVQAAFLLLFQHSYAQLSDDFDTGDLGQWDQQTGTWGISKTDPLSGTGSLQHTYDNPQSGCDQISLRIDSLDPASGQTKWSFRVRHGYPPSSANNWTVYLICHDGDAGSKGCSGQYGIAVGVNTNSSDDTLRLMRIDRGEVHTIINSGMDWEQQIGTREHASVTLIRETSGSWQMSVLDGTSGAELSHRFGYDPWLPEPGSFCICYEYSASQDRKLWIDDLLIEGVFRRDTIPPAILSASPVSDNELLLHLDEPIDSNSITAAEFMLNSEAAIRDSLRVYSGTLVFLRLNASFISADTNTLTISQISDKAGNVANSSVVRFFYYHPQRHDIIFNEIMADPEPTMGLPGSEYIELLNRSRFPINMTGWALCQGSRSWMIGEMMLPPGEYLVITHHGSAGDFLSRQYTLGLLHSPVSIPNEQGQLRIIDRHGQQISFMRYDRGWHHEEYKIKGGWSLECIDPDHFCGGENNWSSSRSRIGGTPGFANSIAGINPDHDHPVISTITCLSAFELQVTFNEAMDPSILSATTTFSVNPGNLAPSGIHPLNAALSSIILEFRQEFYKGTIYRLSCKEAIRDCNGNKPDCAGPVEFAIPERVAPKDILFNELLFNPLPGGVDFIELYNNSRKTIDLSTMYLAGRNETSRQLSDITGISDDQFLIFPGTYVALTPDPEYIKNSYGKNSPDAMIRQSDLPFMGDKEGRIVLLDQWYEPIDELDYSSDMHDPLLSENEGVSLERISFSLPTGDPGNWHSCAAPAGYATPGCVNSQAGFDLLKDTWISITPEVFTPDQDGIDDCLIITCQFEQPGTVLNIIIFDPRGRKIRHLVNNELSGYKGIYHWNGESDSGSPARAGLYLVVAEVFTAAGHRKLLKQTCVLGRRYGH